MGADVASAALNVKGAQKVAAATLEYHWVRAKLCWSGEPRRVPAEASWVAGFEGLVREVMTTAMAARRVEAVVAALFQDLRQHKPRSQPEIGDKALRAQT